MSEYTPPPEAWTMTDAYEAANARAERWKQRHDELLREVEDLRARVEAS